MRKFLLVFLLFGFCSSLYATATLTFTKMGEKKVTISADGFNTTSLDKIIYLNGTEVSRFKKRSAVSQTKDLLLPVGVNRIFVQEGTATSNTLTAKILGHWQDDLSRVAIEISGFEQVQSISVTAAAYSYVYVTSFAVDMLIIENEATSSKPSIYVLTESETASGVGTTQTVRAAEGDTYITLHPEGGVLILEAGDFYRVQLIEGSTGVHYMTLHYLPLSDWKIIDDGLKNE